MTAAAELGGPLRRPAAVLLLGAPAATTGDRQILLVERAATLRHHPGQVALPGGASEPADANPAATALREAQEETGLEPSRVEVLRVLKSVAVTVSCFDVVPVLGWSNDPGPLHAVDPRETAAVFWVPVTDLADAHARVTVVIQRDNVQHLSPGFVVGRRLVWGFTGMLLDRVLTRAGWIPPLALTERRRVDVLG